MRCSIGTAALCNSPGCIASPSRRTRAYVAARWRYWGRERNEMLGDSAGGYIVVPHRQTPEVRVREEHKDAALAESDLDPNPITQFEKWFAEARSAGIQEANAMTLATVSPDGQPSARMVLLKEVNADGFVFYTNYRSQKGRELAANPRAALVFYWPELHRQVRVTGQVSKTSRSDAAAYFSTRPRGAQLGAWASGQSSVIPSREVLERSVERLETKYAGQAVPLPPDWGGYKLRPDTIEFWQGRANRLHDSVIRVRPAARGGSTGWRHDGRNISTFAVPAPPHGVDESLKALLGSLLRFNQL